MDNQNQPPLPQQQSTPSTQAPVTPLPATTHKPNMLFLCICAVILLLVGLTGGYMLRGMNSTPPSPKIEQIAHVSPAAMPDPISPTAVPLSTENSNVANWKTFISSTCNFTIKTPTNWNVKEATGADAGRDFACSYIQAPDYKIVGMDSDEGLSIGILRTHVGIAYKGLATITSPNDYITATETIQEPKVSAKNITDKTYGTNTGKYFEYEAYRNMANFVFQQGNYIYTIQWHIPYEGRYKQDIDTILASLEVK